MQETILSVPNSLTPGRETGPSPLLSDQLHGLPHVLTASALLRSKSVSRLYRDRPTHASSYASLRESPHAAQGLDFLGVDSSQGRNCSIRWCLRFSLTCFLLPVCAGALARAFSTSLEARSRAFRLQDEFENQTRSDRPTARALAAVLATSQSISTREANSLSKLSTRNRPGMNFFGRTEH